MAIKMKNKAILLSLVWLLISVPFYSYLSYLISANSDNMSALLIAKDIASGNYRLDGWSLSTQSYIFSDIIWAVVAIKIFGYSSIIAHVLPAFMYSIMLFVLFFMSTENNRYGWVWLLPILIFPSVFSGAVSFELCIHGGIYFISVAFLYYINRHKGNISFTAVFLMSLISGVVIDSDKLFLYIFTLPLLLSAALHMFLSRSTMLVRVLLMAILSVVFYKLSSLAFKEYFLFTVPGLKPPQLASLPVIKNNILLFWDGLSHLFGFTQINDGVDRALYALKFTICIAFILTSLLCIVRSVMRSFIDCFLALSSGMVICAFVFSNVPTDYYSARFFYCALIFCSLIIARNTKTRPPVLILLLLVVCSIGNIYEYSRITSSKDALYRNLSDFLHKNDMLYGYAPYWEASVVAAHGKVSVIPVDVGSTITPKHWLSNKKDYTIPRNFFLSSDPESLSVAISQFGEPEKTYKLDGITVLEWEELSMPPNGITIKKFTSATGTIAGTYRGGRIYGSGKDGYLIYGPYVPVSKGRYKLFIYGGGAMKGDFVDVSNSENNTSIFDGPLKFNDDGVFEVEVDVPVNIESLEVRVRTSGNENIYLSGYKLKRL